MELDEERLVTCVMPVHRPRFMDARMCAALESVGSQTHPVACVSIAVDDTHAGAAATRNRALGQVRTPWAAFLDSDDTWYPQHVELLLARAEMTGADLVYAHHDIVTGGDSRAWDPFASTEHAEFDEDELRRRNYIPVTVLVRTGLIREAGGFQPLGPPGNPCDDHGAWLALLGAGARFAHLDARTWAYHWWSDREAGTGNTSGSGDRW